MLALGNDLRVKLRTKIEATGVAATRERLGVDEQTMMRAALGVPLRDDVARRIAAAIATWETKL